MYILVFGTDGLAVYVVLGISLGAGVLLSLLVHFIVAPWLKRRILNSERTAIRSSIAADEHDENKLNVPDLMITEERTRKIFIIVFVMIETRTRF